MMFGLIKPAHIQMRGALPARIAIEFDQVLGSFEDDIPRYWDKGSRDRAIAIVMGEWIEGKLVGGEFSISPTMRAKVAHLLGLAERYNAKDYGGNGGSATAFAHDIIRAMREAGWIPSG